MARRPDAISISIQLTPNEHAALEKFAKAIGRDKTFVLRAALGGFVPEFPKNEFTARQKSED